MATPEQFLYAGAGERPAKEIVDPHYHHTAFIFDNAKTHRRDIVVFIDQVNRLGHPVAYWWLSEAMDLENTPDRLILCVRHLSLADDSSGDLYSPLAHAAEKHKIIWDEVSLADGEEFREFGKLITSPGSIFEPDGRPLFPEPETDAELLFTLTRDDVQFAAQEEIGRDLNDDELKAVVVRLLTTFDWISAVEAAIQSCQQLGTVGPARWEVNDEDLDGPDYPEVRMRQLPNSGWSEDFENEHGYFGNVVRVLEGIDDDGQLYVWREWAVGEPPDDFTPHSWGLAFTPDGSDTLDEVLAHLDEMVEKGILTTEERARSEAFYRRLFSK